MKLVSLLTFALAIIYVHCAVPSLKLNTNLEMPQLGLGTWQATGAPVTQAVKDALEIGYRHIDTANVYKNEKEVGAGIHAQINAGILKREDLFITTKVYPQGNTEQKTALDTVKNSLKELNVTYVDLVLVHFPVANYTNSYMGLEDAYNQKLTKSIGISNFERKHIDTLLKVAKVKPAVNQINVHPTLNQDDTIAYSKELGIVVTGYSPLGTGSLVKNPTLAAIGAKHSKTAAQVALRWQIQRGLITIPKALSKAYIKEDFEIFDFELTEAEMTQIHGMK